MPHAFGHYTDPERGLSKGHEYIRDTCMVLQQAHGLWHDDYSNSREAHVKVTDGGFERALM